MKKETEILVEKIKEYLQNNMSEKRFNHSVSVMKKAIELANIYNENEDEAALAGIAHDIAKEIPDDEAFKIAKENGIEFDEIEMMNTKLLHGKIGAFIAGQKYGLNDRIQNAIKIHTTTSPDMDMLAKIIFVADKIEDTRKDEDIDIDAQRKIAIENIDEAIILIIDNSLKKRVAKGKLIHPAGLYTRNKLIIDKMKGENQNGNL